MKELLTKDEIMLIYQYYVRLHQIFNNQATHHSLTEWKNKLSKLC
jgi:hypothetical protein